MKASSLELRAPRIKRGSFVFKTWCLVFLWSLGFGIWDFSTACADEPFVRVHRPDANTVELHVAVRRYESTEKGKPTIVLVGVSHIGEADYYKKLQVILDAQALVLFEGVGGAERPKSTTEAKESRSGDLQSDIARALGLAFQLEEIDYQRNHFRNSDLSPQQIRDLLAAEDKKDSSNGPKAEAQFDTLITALQGNSVLNWLVNFALGFVRSNPTLQATFKLTLIETLGQSGGDVTKMQRLAPQMEKLLRVLVEKRNEAVWRDLIAELQKPNAAKSIALFYGAGHMPDLDRRLRRDLRYTLAEEKWLTAFAVDGAKAGLRPADIETIRKTVERQLGAAGLTPVAAAPPTLRVAPPSPEMVKTFQLSPFYKKHCDAGGIPVVSSEKVSDYALKEAAFLINTMIGKRDDLRAAIIKNRVRFAVMAVGEMTTDIPEHNDLKPKQYWDNRARGLGASRERPAVSCGEENLLGYEGDPYKTENILIHEFGHVIEEMGLSVVDPAFVRRLQQTFDRAMAAGLWKGKYASSNSHEYWAEGVQSWFDTNRENDHDHNHVDTREELKEYDAGLAKLCEEVFGNDAWRYQSPAARKTSAHLEGYDPTQSPRFSWPKELRDWYKAYQAAERGDPLPKNLADWSELKSLPTETPATLRSEKSNQTTSILFVNTTARAMKLFWIDERGARKPYQSIRADGSDWMDTFVGHVFLVTDPDGKPLGAFRAEKPTGRAMISNGKRP